MKKRLFLALCSCLTLLAHIGYLNCVGKSNNVIVGDIEDEKPPVSQTPIFQIPFDGTNRYLAIDLASKHASPAQTTAQLQIEKGTYHGRISMDPGSIVVLPDGSLRAFQNLWDENDPKKAVSYQSVDGIHWDLITDPNYTPDQPGDPETMPHYLSIQGDQDMPTELFPGVPLFESVTYIPEIQRYAMVYRLGRTHLDVRLATSFDGIQFYFGAIIGRFPIGNRNENLAENYDFNPVGVFGYDSINSLIRNTVPDELGAPTFVPMFRETLGTLVYPEGDAPSPSACIETLPELYCVFYSQTVRRGVGSYLNPISVNQLTNQLAWDRLQGWNEELQEWDLNQSQWVTISDPADWSEFADPDIYVPGLKYYFGQFLGLDSVFRHDTRVNNGETAWAGNYKNVNDAMYPTWAFSRGKGSSTYYPDIYESAIDWANMPGHTIADNNTETLRASMYGLNMLWNAENRKLYQYVQYNEKSHDMIATSETPYIDIRQNELHLFLFHEDGPGYYTDANLEDNLASTWTTSPIMSPPGKGTLQINATTQDGFYQVEVLDAETLQALNETLSAEQANIIEHASFIGDPLSLWGETNDLSNFEGTNVVFRFRINGTARIYSFAFRNSSMP